MQTVALVFCLLVVYAICWQVGRQRGINERGRAERRRNLEKMERTGKRGG